MLAEGKDNECDDLDREESDQESDVIRSCEFKQMMLGPRQSDTGRPMDCNDHDQPCQKNNNNSLSLDAPGETNDAPPI
jgi:hypothetical protein